MSKIDQLTDDGLAEMYEDNARFLRDLIPQMQSRPQCEVMAEINRRADQWERYALELRGKEANHDPGN